MLFSIALTLSIAYASDAIAIEAGSVAHALEVRPVWRDSGGPEMLDGDRIFEDLICTNECGPFPEYLDLVNVLEVDGKYAQIEFSTGSQAEQIWVELHLLLDANEFRPINAWQGTPEIVLCDEFSGCYRIRIDTSGQFTWSRIASIQSPWVPNVTCSEQCLHMGQVERRDDLLRFRLGESYEFFRIRDDGRLCWEDGLYYFDTCLPADEANIEF